MTADLAGRVALVTGSSAGIGRAIAEALAERGAAIVAHGLDLAANEAAMHDWRAKGWRCSASTVDLARPDAAQVLHAETCAALGAPDILVLNASVEMPETLVELTADALATQLAVNISTSCLLLQACVPAMADKHWGRVVAIGSVQEERPNAHHLVYAGTKAAVTSVVLNLARHNSSTGVTFNVIRPGAIETDRNRDRLRDPAFRQSVTERIPLRRIGEALDCSGSVSLLCSDAGAYITGAVIAVDGGLRL